MTIAPAPCRTDTASWQHVLLEAPVNHQTRDGLPGFARQVAQDFLEDIWPHPNGGADAYLDRWYASADGQQTLAAFAKALWNQMSGHSANALPGHDARHSMYKVPATALEYMAAENVQGWRRVGVLGALLHDYGRWAEEHYWGEPTAGPLHARLSFLLGQELLMHFEMPQEVKDQILLAALCHQFGAEEEDPMPLKLTVAADREQLYGPEIILRLVHHRANSRGDLASVYGDGRGVSVLDRLFVFLQNRLPGPLYTRQEHVNRLWAVLADFILLCEDEDASRRRFFSNKPVLRQGFDWTMAWHSLQVGGASTEDPVAAANAFLRAPHVAACPAARLAALAKVDVVPDASKQRLARALAFAHGMRQMDDVRQLLALHEIQESNVGDALVTTLCELLTTTWDGGLHPRLP